MEINSLKMEINSLIINGNIDRVFVEKVTDLVNKCSDANEIQPILILLGTHCSLLEKKVCKKNPTFAKDLESTVAILLKFLLGSNSISGSKLKSCLRVAINFCVIYQNFGKNAILDATMSYVVSLINQDALLAANTLGPYLDHLLSFQVNCLLQSSKSSSSERHALWNNLICFFKLVEDKARLFLLLVDDNLNPTCDVHCLKSSAPYFTEKYTPNIFKVLNKYLYHTLKTKANVLSFSNTTVCILNQVIDEIEKISDQDERNAKVIMVSVYKFSLEAVCQIASSKEDEWYKALAALNSQIVEFSKVVTPTADVLRVKVTNSLLFLFTHLHGQFRQWANVQLMLQMYRNLFKLANSTPEEADSPAVKASETKYRLQWLFQCWNDCLRLMSDNVGLDDLHEEFVHTLTAGHAFVTPMLLSSFKTTTCSDAKVTSSDAKVTFSDVHVSSSDVKVSSSDAKVTFSDVHVSSSDVKVSSSDAKVTEFTSSARSSLKCYVNAVGMLSQNVSKLDERKKNFTLSETLLPLTLNFFLTVPEGLIIPSLADHMSLCVYNCLKCDVSEANTLDFLEPLVLLACRSVNLAPSVAKYWMRLQYMMKEQTECEKEHLGDHLKRMLPQLEVKYPGVTSVDLCEGRFVLGVLKGELDEVLSLTHGLPSDKHGSSYESSIIEQVLYLIQADKSPVQDLSTVDVCLSCLSLVNSLHDKFTKEKSQIKTYLARLKQESKVVDKKLSAAVDMEEEQELATRPLLVSLLLAKSTILEHMEKVGRERAVLRKQAKILEHKTHEENALDKGIEVNPEPSCPARLPSHINVLYNSTFCGRLNMAAMILGRIAQSNVEIQLERLSSLTKLDHLVDNILYVAYSYRLCLEENKEIEFWKLVCHLSARLGLDALFITCVYNLLWLGQDVKTELSDRAVEILKFTSARGISEDVKAMYHFSKIKKKLELNQVNEALEDLSHISNLSSEPQTVREILIATNYWYLKCLSLMKQDNLTPMQHANIAQCAQLSFKCIFRNFDSVSHVSSLVVQLFSCYFNMVTLIVRFHSVHMNPREAKAILNTAIKFAQDLCLPLWTAKLLSFSASLDVMTCNRDELGIKISYLEQLLKQEIKQDSDGSDNQYERSASQVKKKADANESAPKDLNLLTVGDAMRDAVITKQAPNCSSLASPRFVSTVSNQLPAFIGHRSCTSNCFECQNAVYHDQLISLYLLRGLWYQLGLEYDVAMFCFENAEHLLHKLKILKAFPEDIASQWQPRLAYYRANLEGILHKADNVLKIHTELQLTAQASEDYFEQYFEIQWLREQYLMFLGNNITVKRVRTPSPQRWVESCTPRTNELESTILKKLATALPGRKFNIPDTPAGAVKGWGKVLVFDSEDECNTSHGGDTGEKNGDKVKLDVDKDTWSVCKNRVAPLKSAVEFEPLITEKFGPHSTSPRSSVSKTKNRRKVLFRDDLVEEEMSEVNDPTNEMSEVNDLTKEMPKVNDLTEEVTGVNHLTEMTQREIYKAGETSVKLSVPVLTVNKAKKSGVGVPLKKPVLKATKESMVKLSTATRKASSKDTVEDVRASSGASRIATVAKETCVNERVKSRRTLAKKPSVSSRRTERMPSWCDKNADGMNQLNQNLADLQIKASRDVKPKLNLSDNSSPVLKKPMTRRTAKGKVLCFDDDLQDLLPVKANTLGSTDRFEKNLLQGGTSAPGGKRLESLLEESLTKMTLSSPSSVTSEESLPVTASVRRANVVPSSGSSQYARTSSSESSRTSISLSSRSSSLVNSNTSSPLNLSLTTSSSKSSNFTAISSPQHSASATSSSQSLRSTSSRSTSSRSTTRTGSPSSRSTTRTGSPSSRTISSRSTTRTGSSSSRSTSSRSTTRTSSSSSRSTTATGSLSSTSESMPLPTPRTRARFLSLFSSVASSTDSNRSCLTEGDSFYSLKDEKENAYNLKTRGQKTPGIKDEEDKEVEVFATPAGKVLQRKDNNEVFATSACIESEVKENHPCNQQRTKARATKPLATPFKGVTSKQQDEDVFLTPAVPKSEKPRRRPRGQFPKSPFIM